MIDPSYHRPSNSFEHLRQWNDTCTAYPREQSICALFDEIVARQGHAIALTSEGRHLTYEELNGCANRLAIRLRKLGVSAEATVGCCLPRSLELIIALLGILKAGAAYVPLDPTYPKERFRYLLSDSQPALVLADSSIADTLVAETGVPILPVGELYSGSADGSDYNNLPATRADDLAYIMYTSGSTGLPKGVMVEHRAVVRLVRNTNYCRFGPDQVFLLNAPISFDASTFEIWGALLNGGRLVLMPPQAPSLAELGRIIQEQKVTTLWLTAGLFQLMVEERLDDLSGLRELLAGGDVLSPTHVQRLLNYLPDCVLVNGYGPTENTTFTCCHVMRGSEGGAAVQSIPIGRPISNTTVYLLDENLQPLPPGVVGELYAGGDGVARGYLNHPKETAEKFISDPFSRTRGSRMYRTGDLACWRPDGVIEFHGRKDNQIKVLGHRVEPGEVEAALRTYGPIQDACVVAYSEENGSRHLAAYYIPSGSDNVSAEVSAESLRAFLLQKLPHYMIPAAFQPLQSFPLTPNGKIDRAALPRPIRQASSGVDSPTNLENTIASTWRRLLNVEEVGLDTNFFELGGDSLSLVAAHSTLQKMLGIEIPITDLFEFTTVRSLANRIANTGAEKPLIDAHDRALKQRQAFSRQRDRRMALSHE